ncbi:hypothetical protein GCM10010230_22560 [Streptomyces narbonensis]|nr:hypothetical protein GCM10010230_22560 [Streptomyces narbonensis]
MGGVVGAGRADDAGADDDDIRGFSRGHVSNISHCTDVAKTPKRSIPVAGRSPEYRPDTDE